MQLQTPVSIPPLMGPKLALGSPVLLLGSCFAKHMGQYLAAHKFQAMSNPAGILFNPLSLARLLRWAWGEEAWEEPAWVVEQEGVWRHLHLHSQVFGRSEQALLEAMQAVRDQTAAWAQRASHGIITLGTAWVYEHIETGAVVANCHKMPSRGFRKRLLHLEEVSEALREIGRLLPQATLLLTVSPVRHIKDGLPENAVSKSILRLACHAAEGEGIGHYFPAYELMNDELRDYRFYEADMLHPNAQAVSYIWQRFAHWGMDEEAQRFLADWGPIKRGLAHRPMVPYTEAHGKFLERLIASLEALPDGVDVSEELQMARNALAKC